MRPPLFYFECVCVLHFCDGQSATPYEDGEGIECQLRTPKATGPSDPTRLITFLLSHIAVSLLAYFRTSRYTRQIRCFAPEPTHMPFPSSK